MKIVSNEMIIVVVNLSHRDENVFVVLMTKHLINIMNDLINLVNMLNELFAINAFMIKLNHLLIIQEKVISSVLNLNANQN